VNLDRGALERVLARAAELQASSADAPEQFSEAQLLDMGKEVGLDAAALRQALAEERTRTAAANEDSGFGVWLVGSGRVSARRIVRGTQDDVLAALDAWMRREELLSIKRQRAERVVWEPRRDVFSNLRRFLDIGGRGYALTLADEVAATVQPIDADQVLVQMDVTLFSHREKLAGGVVGLSGLGAAATGVFFVMSVMPAFAVVPVAVLPLIGAAAARSSHRHVVERTQLALEQVLDRLERGDFGRPPSLLGALAAAAAALPAPPRPRRL
jgi:uncharacterized membrane protein